MLSPESWDECNRNFYFATLVRELECIRLQVQEDLLETLLVAADDEGRLFLTCS